MTTAAAACGRTGYVSGRARGTITWTIIMIGCVIYKFELILVHSHMLGIVPQPTSNFPVEHALPQFEGWHQWCG